MNFPAPPSFHEQPQPSRQAPINSSQQALALAQHQHQHQQQQQQQQQQLYLMNGMNGGNVPGGMGVPTPAGHQAELNYIYGMVEDLSRQLAENRRVTEDIVNGLGRVRSRARVQGLGNEELINIAAEDINALEQNLDHEISLLTESLEKAKYSRDANANLLSAYAHAMSLMLKQFHEYKAKHVTDVAAWHQSYRAQLAEARSENSRLRDQIWEMQDRAGKANALLREFRRKYDEDDARWERRVDERAVRQELRFWKRMAMPELADDDPYWSDDDDLIDKAEKERLAELERKAAQMQLASGDHGGDEESHQGLPPPPVPGPPSMGGVPMQRDDSGAFGVPNLPPRPSSQASSTGSSGQ